MIVGGQKKDGRLMIVGRKMAGIMIAGGWKEKTIENRIVGGQKKNLETMIGWGLIKMINL